MNAANSTTAATAATIIGCVIAILGVVWGAVRWLMAPHLRESIRDTITVTVGERLDEVPKLTVAVDRLTGAIERQTTDTKELSESMGDLRVEVDNLKLDVRELSTRTEALGKMRERPDDLPIEQPRRRRRKAS